MKFEIHIVDGARQDLLDAFDYIFARSPKNAIAWLSGINAAINSLKSMPNRCSIAPESDHLRLRLHHLLYESHRIIYFVDEPAKIVQILYVRHGAMRAVGEPYEDER